MRMSEILLTTDQSTQLEYIQKEYYLRLEIMFILDSLLNYLYDCQFYKFFDLSKIFRRKKVRIFFYNNF